MDLLCRHSLSLSFYLSLCSNPKAIGDLSGLIVTWSCFRGIVRTKRRGAGKTSQHFLFAGFFSLGQRKAGRKLKSGKINFRLFFFSAAAPVFRDMTTRRLSTTTTTNNHELVFFVSGSVAQNSQV